MKVITVLCALVGLSAAFSKYSCRSTYKLTELFNAIYLPHKQIFPEATSLVVGRDALLEAVTLLPDSFPIRLHFALLTIGTSVEDGSTTHDGSCLLRIAPSDVSLLILSSLSELCLVPLAESGTMYLLLSTIQTTTPTLWQTISQLFRPSIALPLMLMWLLSP